MMNLMNIRNAAKCFAVWSMVLAITAAGGCASSSAPPAASSPANGSAMTASQSAAPHAECLVCKYDADLACVDVTVEKDTPTYTYGGKTYYFCSKSCCKKFEKDPAKYISQK